jgi:hypothetical protein
MACEDWWQATLIDERLDFQVPVADLAEDASRLFVERDEFAIVPGRMLDEDHRLSRSRKGRDARRNIESIGRAVAQHQHVLVSSKGKEVFDDLPARSRQLLARHLSERDGQRQAGCRNDSPFSLRDTEFLQNKGDELRNHGQAGVERDSRPAEDGRLPGGDGSGNLADDPIRVGTLRFRLSGRPLAPSRLDQ